MRCLAEKEDVNDRRKKVAAGIGTGAFGVGVLILKKGKDIIKYIPKLK